MNAETFWILVPWLHGRSASMGPRSHERGNDAEFRCVGTLCRLMLQWGRVLMNAETLPFQKRTVELKIDDALQWGRVLMNAETPLGLLPERRALTRTHGKRASMGPRSHERGNRPLDNSLRNKGFFACYREVVVCTRSHWLVGRVVMA